MALLQIAEPGQTTAPHQARLAVGIDLWDNEFIGRNGAKWHGDRVIR